MSDKQPDGSPTTGSPASTNEPLSSPAREQGPLSKRAPGSPPGFRNGFAKWVISAGQPPAAPPVVAAPAPAPEPAPALVPASERARDESEVLEVAPVPRRLPSVPPEERTQLFQRVPEHLMRKARASEPAPPGLAEDNAEEEADVWDAREELGSRPRGAFAVEDERTAAFTPPSELLSAAKRRRAMQRPAAGTPPPPRPSSPGLIGDEPAPLPEDEAIAEVSARIAALSGARKSGEDVTRVTASYRRLMASENAGAPLLELERLPQLPELPKFESIAPEPASRGRKVWLWLVVLLVFAGGAVAVARFVRQ